MGKVRPVRSRVLRRDLPHLFSGCGGARQADHLQSVTDRPDLAWDLANIRPAHGAPGNPCPSCSAAAGRKVHCNQLKGGYSVQRAQRIIAEWIAAAGGAPAQARPKPEPGAGRPWLGAFAPFVLLHGHEQQGISFGFVVRYRGPVF
jgi:hypothetical protein